jgi:hypothetical protein
MKHMKKVTVAKADVWSDISTFFENLWKDISDFFKGRQS